MSSLKRRKELLKVKETIDMALWEWYSERELEVPRWRSNKDPQWWIDYLAEIEKEKNKKPRKRKKDA